MASVRKRDELVYVPLGGAGEIGMNLYLYGFGPERMRQWIIVDVGIGFPDEAMLPGVDVLMPDIRFLEAERANLLGIVLTHAHEDHYGAVATLWPRLKVPVYATLFTATLLRARLEELGLEETLPVNVLDLGARFKLGPFDLEYVTMTHSIPEPSGLIIRTEAGTVLHTGDWKIDDRPVIGAPTDEGRLKALGRDGCNVMLCDSTNVFREGSSVSETDVAASLAAIISAAPARVAVTTFSSNVARILSVARAGQRAGREVVVAGRALARVIAAARATGYLEGVGRILEANDFGYLPPDKALVLVTGSQGEHRAALSRIAHKSHPAIKLDKGDLVIFSAKTIPGNERSVSVIENRLAEQGIDVIDAESHLVHVTGHPRRDELKQMYDWVRPGTAVPMHGEIRHLVEHTKLARECGVANALVVANGAMARLAPGPVEIIDEVPAGRLLRDGNLLVPDADPGVRERRRLANAGAVFVALVIDQRGEVVSDPEYEIVGLPEIASDGREFSDVIENAIDTALDALPQARRRDPDHAAEMVRRAVRSSVLREWGKKTECRVSVSQI